MYIEHSNINYIFLGEVSSDEISKVINCPGWDDINSKVGKSTYHLYITPLKYLINLSLAQGVFSKELKIAKVIPIYKSGDCKTIKNYKPVSVLPVFSTVFERIMYNRFFSFLNSFNLLYKYQFRFREKYGTNMALIVLVDKMLKALDEGNIVLGVFLDVSKAFDTVDHFILLKKIFKYGMGGSALKWMTDYLKERPQCVIFNRHCSSNEKVPQGSILVPLLFLTYVNDMSNVSQLLFTLLFADDTNVFTIGKDVRQSIAIMNNELTKIVEWLNVNKLSLNVKKTHYMIFSLSRNRNINDTDTKIIGQMVARVACTNFLGVLIDEKLSWENHIKSIKMKIS